MKLFAPRSSRPSSDDGTTSPFEIAQAAILNGLRAYRLDPSTRQKLAEVERDYETWLRTCFPSAVSRPLAPHQHVFWEWLWALEALERPLPFVGIWARKGGKSTNVELGVTAVAARSRRRYGLYVCRTQAQADDHVFTIARRFTSDAFAEFYPQHANRSVGKFGSSDAWRRNRIITSGGFILDAMGVDSARRGAKIEDSRPDFIILDDIDEKLDTPDQTAKLVKVITESILPLGGGDTAVLAVQNLIIPHGVFAQLAKRSKADLPDLDVQPAGFLRDRIVSGPHPAVIDLAYELVDGDAGARWRVTGGTPTWEGQDLEDIENDLNTEGPTSVLREKQHEVAGSLGSLFRDIDFDRIRVDQAELPDLVRVLAIVDPAVTSTKASDRQAICIVGETTDDRIIFLYTFEDRDTPVGTITRAYRKLIEHGGTQLVVETNQGGDTWESVVEDAWGELRADAAAPEINASTPRPQFEQAKVSSGDGPKHLRHQQLHSLYELDRVRHVVGTHHVLERALGRLPEFKPFDLPDAAWEAARQTIGFEVPLRAGAPRRS